MQLFHWVGPGCFMNGRVQYQAFALDGVTYRVGYVRGCRN